MTGGSAFGSWRRGRRSASAMEHVPSPVRRHVVSVPVGPDAVRSAREALAGRFGQIGVAPGSAFTDTVLPGVSELVVNVLRHAPRPVTDAGSTVGAGQLVDGVAEPAAEYDGDISTEPAMDHDGKVLLVRFRMPAQAISRCRTREAGRRDCA